jgi:hypothetical protein
MKSICIVALLCAAGLGCLTPQPAGAAKPWVLYDDFSSTFLNPDRWPDTNLERSRLAVGGGLALTARDWGGTVSDSGRQSFSWSDAITRSSSVTQFRALVKILAVENTGCAANSTPTRSRARLLASFFNTGGRATGSQFGDVLAQVNVYRDSNSLDAPGVLQVNASAFVCSSADCSTSSGIGATASLGTVSVGQNVLLQIEWDKAAKTLTFSRDQGASTATIPYGNLDDHTEPGNPFKIMALRNEVANCASGPRALGYISARFDSVAVNKVAKP